MKTARGLWLWALVLALFGACSSSHELGNKNTNWLSLCSSSAECGDADCLCGVCTRSCEGATDCATASGTCAESFASTTQCSGTAQSGMCLAPCTVAADCDDASVCVGGSCVARPKSRCADHADSLACSGFDAAATGDWVTASSPNSDPSTIGDPRFAGEAALRARTSGANGRSRLLHEFAPISSGSMYLRAWMYMAPGTVVDDVHSIVIGDADTGDYGTKFLFSNGMLRVATPTLDVDGSVAPPFGRWYCLRLELGIGADGSVRAFVDDQLFADQAGVPTLPAAGVHNISVGIDFAGQTKPAELFVDELLLSTTPVTCWE